MNILRVVQVIGETKDTLSIKRVKRIISNILSEPSLYPTMKRKSERTRKKELWDWYFKNKEVCLYYNSYGLDIDGFRNQDNYIPYRQFRIERDKDNFTSLNQIRINNKISVLRDKVIFSSFFGTLLGEKYVIPNIGKMLSDGGGGI